MGIAVVLTASGAAAAALLALAAPASAQDYRGYAPAYDHGYDRAYDHGYEHAYDQGGYVRPGWQAPVYQERRVEYGYARPTYARPFYAPVYYGYGWRHEHRRPWRGWYDGYRGW